MTRLAMARRIFLAASVSLLAGAVAPPSFANETIRIGAPFGAIPGVKTAIEEGLFAKVGLNIEIVTLSGGPNILAATVGGSLEIGYADLFAWVGARENGFDLTLLQGANGRGNSDYIVAGRDSGIRTPSDLVGKKIGTAAHAQSRLRVRLYLERFGVDPEKVEYVIINQRETVGAALSTGQIDAAIASDPNVAQWEIQYGVKPLEGRPWEQVPEKTSTAGFFAKSDWVSKNSATVEKFVRAAREGAKLYNAYSAVQKANISQKYDGVDLNALALEVPGIIDRLNDNNAAQSGALDIEATLTWLKIAQEKGVIKQVPDIESLAYTTATSPLL